jgi:hypothetical protein
MPKHQPKQEEYFSVGLKTGEKQPSGGVVYVHSGVVST